MHCLVGCLALLAPRLALFLVWLFSDLVNTSLWTVLGFFFLPLTTLVFAWCAADGGGIVGIEYLFLVFAVMFDLGAFKGAHSSTRRNDDA